MKVIQIKKYNDNLVSIYIHNLKLKIKTWRCMALEILIRLGEQHDQDFIIPIRSYVFLFFLHFRVFLNGTNFFVIFGSTF